jgi:hypothetical protein
MKEAERVEQKARLLEAVRCKLDKMFGPGYEIEVGIIDEQRISAVVDDVLFNTFIYNEEVITVIPVGHCPSCNKDALLGAVNDLAELGEALEEFELGLRHQCR